MGIRASTNPAKAWLARTPRSRRQARRHPLLHHHDRRVAARHSRQRLRRRSRCDRLGHVRGRRMSPNMSTRTNRAPAGKQIIQMLIDGELDAVLGEKCDASRIWSRCLPTSPPKRKRWLARHERGADQPHGGGEQATVRARSPDVVREVHRMLEASSRRRQPASACLSACGCESLAGARLSDYSAQQKLDSAQRSALMNCSTT